MLRRLASASHQPPPLGQAGCYASATAQCRQGYAPSTGTDGGYVCCPVQRLDPLVDIGLTTAGQILSQNDKGAPETMALIRRIIVAPPPPWSGWFGNPGAKKPAFSKLSDLNGTLSAVAYARENPWTIPLAALGTLAAVFFIGRATAPKPRPATGGI